MILRPATMSDAPFLFRLRNDPETRRQSFYSSEISEERHRQWLENLLLSTRRLLFVAEDPIGSPIGYARLTLDAATSEAEVSLAVAPEARGYGWAPEIIKAMLAEGTARGIHQFSARIRPSNGASLTSFERAGFSVLLIEMTRTNDPPSRKI